MPNRILGFVGKISNILTMVFGDWRDGFSRKQKVAILKSLLFIAYADNHMNYSENKCIIMLMIQMGLIEDDTIKQEVNELEFSDMISTIKSLNSNKKNLVKEQWIDLMKRAYGGVAAGYFNLKDYPKESVIFESMSAMCCVDIDDVLKGEYIVDIY